MLTCALSAQEARWQELDKQTTELHQQGKYAAAAAAGEEALRIAEATFGGEDKNVAAALNNLAVQYIAIARYAEAGPLLHRALAIDEKSLGPEHPDVATTLNHLADLYRAQGKYAEAAPLYQRSLAIQERKLGPENPDVAATLNDIAELYAAQARYADAVPLLQRALAIDEKVFGPEHPDLATTLKNLAGIYVYLGKPNEAEPLYRRCLAIREKTLGPEHPDVAKALRNLATLFTSQGKYAQAEPLFRRSLAISEKGLGSDHPVVALALSDLAELLLDGQGKYAEAEPLLRRSLAIDEKTLGPHHPEVANALGRLAMMYDAQGKYVEAEPLFRRSLAIREQALGPGHPDVAITLNGLANLYSEQGKYSEAAAFYRRALVIDERTLGPNDPDVAALLSNLADTYRFQGKYAEAETLFHRSLTISEKTQESDNRAAATTLNNLADLYRVQGKYSTAGPVYRRSLALFEKTLGPDHPDVATPLSNLGLLYYAEGRHAEAGPFFDRGLANVKRQFLYHFSYMSERERLQFLAVVADIFPDYFSFVVAYRDKDPLLAGKMFDVVLWEKGFIGQSIAALRARVAAGGDPAALKLFEELAAKKTELATLINTPSDDHEAWKKQVADLDRKADGLEKDLVRRSSTLQEEKKLATVTWQELQRALKPHEAAVEIVEFPFITGGPETDIAAGRTYYVALVLKPDSKVPQLIVLDDGTDAERSRGPVPAHQTRAEMAMEDYRNLANPEIQQPEAGQKFYATFWKPLAAALGNAKTIYLAPDGELNQVALNIVPAADGKLFLEQYDLRIVTNTKDLLKPTHLTSDKTATLVGNPRFLLSDDQQTQAIAAFRAPLPTPGQAKPVLLATAGENPVSGLRPRDLQQRNTTCPDRPADGFLCPLPNTATEISAIGGLLTQASWVVSTYHDEGALEEVVKSVRHPRVLHLATHGFFLSDQQMKRLRSPDAQQSTDLEDPMLRSGLLLAGADRVLKRRPPLPDADDGVLTAYEASSLDLNGTELVVLSACETGLGETHAGEGVFGLRRAFEVAGAESVLMSMWKVPDRETSDLMSSFYSKWLGGMEKHQALRAAQLELRQKIIAREGHDIPYFWGAWVLVGK